MLRAASDEQWTQLRADVGRLVARRLPTSADVEDVVQDVLLRVWRHADDLRDDERFGAWLSRIAYTAAADHMRARQRHPVPRHSPNVDEETGTESNSADEFDGESEAKDLIAAVLRPFVEALPDTYREAIVLTELEGLPYSGVAGRLGLSVSGVKSRVQRGRSELRSMLERCCEIALDARGAPLTCDLKPGGVVPAGCCSGDRTSAGQGSGCSSGPLRPSPARSDFAGRTSG